MGTDNIFVSIWASEELQSPQRPTCSGIIFSHSEKCQDQSFRKKKTMGAECGIRRWHGMTGK
jgi:hypothetical protein